MQARKKKTGGGAGNGDDDHAAAQAACDEHSAALRMRTHVLAPSPRLPLVPIIPLHSNPLDTTTPTTDTHARNTSTMPLIYSAVARGAAVLAEYGVIAGNFGAVARDCLAKSPADGRTSHSVDGHVFSLLTAGGFSEYDFECGGLPAFAQERTRATSNLRE